MLAIEIILCMQVDLVKRHCFPVYWNAENRRVMRGHWFARKGGLDWLPLREDVGEQLEIAYRSQVCFLFSKRPPPFSSPSINIKNKKRSSSFIFIQSPNSCLKILYAKHRKVFMMKKMLPCEMFSFIAV